MNLWNNMYIRSLWHQNKMCLWHPNLFLLIIHIGSFSIIRNFGPSQSCMHNPVRSNLLRPCLHFIIIDFVCGTYGFFSTMNDFLLVLNGMFSQHWNGIYNAFMDYYCLCRQHLKHSSETFKMDVCINVIQISNISYSTVVMMSIFFMLVHPKMVIQIQYFSAYLSRKNSHSVAHCEIHQTKNQKHSIYRIFHGIIILWMKCAVKSFRTDLNNRHCRSIVKESNYRVWRRNIMFFFFHGYTFSYFRF